MIELIGESLNPGPTGGLDVRSSEDRHGLGASFWVGFALAVLAIGAVHALIFTYAASLTLTAAATAAFITLVYLLCGYWLHPEPDMSSLGWAGGLIDHPFRYSDDINRSLLLFKVALWPGRRIAEGIVAVTFGLSQPRRRRRRRRSSRSKLGSSRRRRARAA